MTRPQPTRPQPPTPLPDPPATRPRNHPATRLRNPQATRLRERSKRRPLRRPPQPTHHSPQAPQPTRHPPQAPQPTRHSQRAARGQRRRHPRAQRDRVPRRGATGCGSWTLPSRLGDMASDAEARLAAPVAATMLSNASRSTTPTRRISDLSPHKPPQNHPKVLRFVTAAAAPCPRARWTRPTHARPAPPRAATRRARSA